MNFGVRLLRISFKSSLSTFTLLLLSVYLNSSCAVNDRPPQTIPASGVSLSDVRAAIDTARPGDTVMVPEGSATWTEQLLIRKGINLIGAGIGRTIITNAWRTTGYNQGLIYYYPSNPAANEPFRFSGFEINGNGPGQSVHPNTHGYSQFLTIRNTGRPYLTNIRIDNNKFYNCGKGNWISIIGNIAGVADNNIIGDANYDHYGGNKIFHSGKNNDTWRYETFQYGSAQQFYWEDNEIYIHGQSGVCMGYYGAKYAFRYNTVYYTPDQNFWLFDMHGNKSDPRMTSTMGVEIYENNIICAYNRGGLLVDHRGGMLIAFNNSHNRAATSMNIQLREEYHDELSPPAQSPDGQNQHVDRSYYWNNTNGLGQRGLIHEADKVDYGGAKGLAPQNDREFWKQVDSFNGSTGMGVGLLSARPSSCTLQGAGYWATDEKRLYRWRNGAWELYFTPYTYPHPLRKD